MKKITSMTAIAAIILLVAFKPISPSSWSLDKEHSRLGFVITHLMVNDVEGSFKNFDAKITCTKEDFTDAVVELTAEINSVNTDNEKRDAHLTGPDFFDAAKYPTLTFKSKSFKKSKDNNYIVTGDLTMHGVTKPVSLQAVAKTGTNPMSKKTITGFKVTGVFKRTDFNLGTTVPSSMLGDEVTLNANTEFTQD